MFSKISKIHDVKSYSVVIIYDAYMLTGRKNMITFSILGFSLISTAILVIFS
jgi:hypothetical protein